MAWNPKVTKFFVYVLLTFVVSTYLSSKILADDLLDVTRAIITSNYWVGISIYFIVAVSITALAIPFAVLDLLNVYIFPFPICMLIMLAEKTIGTALVYEIANQTMHSSKEEYLKINLIKRVNKVIKDSPLYYGTLVRFSSVPASVKNYGLAALEISFKDYMITSMIGSAVFIPLKTYVNYQMIEMYDNLRKGEVVLPSINLVIAVISIISMGFVIKKILNETSEDETEIKEDETKEKKD